MMPLFSKLASLTTGMCYLDKFSANMGLVVSEPVVKLYEMFDKVRFFCM